MKRIISLILALSMLLVMSACSKSGGASSGAASSASAASDLPAASSAPAESEAPPEEVAKDWTNINPLTGEATETDISQNRPVAVMLNNIKQALPQSGNSQADLYYEVPEEGGITRIMALYQDIDGVGIIGSVRSTRPYFVRLALAEDAVLVHAGGSGTAYKVLEKYDMDDIDSIRGNGTGSFYRDKARRSAGYALEHTLFTTSDMLMEYFETHSDVRTTHEEDFEPAQTFVEDGTPEGGSTADTISVPFSGYKTGVFEYEESTGTYGVNQFGSAYIDQQNGEQIHVTNVIVVKTDISVIEGDNKGRLAVTLTGSGNGFYACGGKYIPIVWNKDDVQSQYEFTTIDGQPLELGVGKTYVNIVPDYSEVSFK